MRTLHALLLAFLVGCVASAAPPSSSSGGGGGGGASSGSTITADETLAGCEALTPSAGDVCYPTDSLYVLVSRSDGAWAYTIPGIEGDLTKPPSTGWTVFNSSTVATAGGIRWVTLPNEAFGSGGWRGETRSEPSDPSVSPYYAEFVIVGTDFGFVGPGFSDGTALQIGASRHTNRDFQVARYTTATTGGTADLTYIMSVGDHLRIRLEHDGANREFFVYSQDGTWNEIESGADGVTFTSDAVGWWGAIVTTGVSNKIGLAHYAEGAL